jgi:hypothetical protein
MIGLKATSALLLHAKAGQTPGCGQKPEQEQKSEDSGGPEKELNASEEASAKSGLSFIEDNSSKDEPVQQPAPPARGLPIHVSENLTALSLELQSNRDIHKPEISQPNEASPGVGLGHSG